MDGALGRFSRAPLGVSRPDQPSAFGFLALDYERL